jgi:hypothetical protein
MTAAQDGHGYGPHEHEDVSGHDGGGGGRIVAAHTQLFVHRYLVKYPAHDPRDHDPHKADFLEWKRRRKQAGTYWCDFAREHRNADYSECTPWPGLTSGGQGAKPLEAHHKVIELAMMNEIDFALLDADYPGISAPTVGAWIDGDANLTLLCTAHHRGPGGVHVASFSDFGSEYYIRDLITGA